MEPSYNSGGQGVPGVNPGVVASGPSISGSPSSMSLNSVGQKKDKKGPLIAGIIVVVVLAIVAVTLGIIMVNKNGEGNVAFQKEEPINLSSFNKLINYVTYGVEDDVVVEHDPMEYYLDDLNASQKKQAYAKISELMKKFVGDYDAYYNGLSDQDKSERDERLMTLVSSTNDMFNFINVMEFKTKISGYRIWKLSETESVEKAKEQAMEYYDFSSIGSNYYVTQFMDSYENWVDALFSDSGDVNYAYKYVEQYYNMTNDFIGSLYNINNLLNGESAMGGVNE